MDVHKYNPFKRHEEYMDGSILAYKVLTFVSWLLVHITNIHFAWNAPSGSSAAKTIWGQNEAYPTPFSLNPTIVNLYWIVILILQVGYMYHLWAGDHIATAANVGSHFIANNLLMFGFVMLWVRGIRFFWVAEALLIINFFNLSALYFRHSTSPLLIHIPVVSGPLAWNFVALYWCGAAMVNATGLVPRLLANVAIWGILAYGLFFLAAYRDYTMGFALSVLSAALGVHQLLFKIVALQWIFAFVIMGVLFVGSFALELAEIFGKDIGFRRAGEGGEDEEEAVEEDDAETRPLLND